MAVERINEEERLLCEREELAGDSPRSFSIHRIYFITKLHIFSIFLRTFDHNVNYKFYTKNKIASRRISRAIDTGAVLRFIRFTLHFFECNCHLSGIERCVPYGKHRQSPLKKSVCFYLYIVIDTSVTISIKSIYISGYHIQQLLLFTLKISHYKSCVMRKNIERT